MAPIRHNASRRGQIVGAVDAGLLPPSSKVTLARCRPAAAMITLPTAGLPVKKMWSTGKSNNTSATLSSPSKANQALLEHRLDDLADDPRGCWCQRVGLHDRGVAGRQRGHRRLEKQMKWEIPGSEDQADASRLIPFRGGSSCRIRGSSCSRYLTRLPDWPSGSAAQSEPVTQKTSLRGRGLPAGPSPVIPSGRLCRDGEGQQVRHGERARGRAVASRQVRRPARRFQIRFMIGAQQSENHLGHDPASDLPEALASVL